MRRVILCPNPFKDRNLEVTREAMALIDKAVQETPEQWFWYNSRWILQPPKKRKKHKRCTA